MTPDHVLDAEPVVFSMSEPGTAAPITEPDADEAEADDDDVASDDGDGTDKESDAPDAVADAPCEETAEEAVAVTSDNEPANPAEPA